MLDQLDWLTITRLRAAVSGDRSDELIPNRYRCALLFLLPVYARSCPEDEAVCSADATPAHRT